MARSFILVDNPEQLSVDTKHLIVTLASSKNLVVTTEIMTALTADLRAKVACVLGENSDSLQEDIVYVPIKEFSAKTRELAALKSGYTIVGDRAIWDELRHTTDVVYIPKVQAESLRLERVIPFKQGTLGGGIVQIAFPIPFEPTGIEIAYEGLSKFMEVAALARENSLDVKMPIGAVLVNADGKLIAIGTNGSYYHKDHATDADLAAFGGCKRLKEGWPSGTGYEHCEGCNTHNHSEPTVIGNAIHDGRERELPVVPFICMDIGGPVSHVGPQ